MPRTKIVVSAAALGDRKRPFHINVLATTTSSQVVAKVLQKLQSRDPPLRYQLWAASAEREQSLRDGEQPAAVKEKWAEPGVEPQFQLRLRASGIIRVQHRLTGDQETFRSLIVTPHMTSGDVLQVALAQIAPHEQPTNYHLIEKTPHGERVVGEEECPLLLQTGATQLLLRNKLHPPPLTGTLNTPPELSSTYHPHSPFSSSSSPGPTPSALSVQRSWLSMHGELISSLSQFTAALQSQGAEPGEQHGSRTRILEQSLVQQNQVVEMLQKTVGSLESENERVRERTAGFERRVQALKMWKMRARLAEERLKEMAESSGVLGSAQSGIVSFSALASFEKMLIEKDRKIASLQSRVEGGGGGSAGLEKEKEQSSMSLQARLVEERVRVLELEEELLTAREVSARAQRDLSDRQSDVARRESEIQFLRREVEAARKVEAQLREVMMGLRTALLDRDAQISSLTRALEQSSAERERRKSAPAHRPDTIFDLLLGREVFNVELTRQSEKRELGFSVSQFQMPISSRISSLIVTAVKDGSPAQGLLLPGDEILEVNGLNCRSSGSQRKAVEVLERSKDTLKIVAARESGPVEYVGRMKSTPVVSEGSSSTLWTTANDASFSPIPPSHRDSAPHHYQLSLSTSPGSAPPYTVPLTSHSRPQPIGQGKLLEPTSPETANRKHSHLEEESLARLKESQAEVEEELEAAHSEIERLKMEHQLTTVENFDLQQQLKTSEREMSDHKRKLEDLQELLAGEREKLGREKERASGLEHQNSFLQTRLSEANSARDAERQRGAQTQEEMVKLKLDFEREKSELLTEMATKHSRNEQLQAELSSELARAEVTLSQVSERDSQLEREKREGEQLVQQLTTELLELREKSAREVTSLETETDRLQNQLSTATTQLETLGKRETEMKAELRHLRQVAGESNKQLVEQETAHRRLREQLALIREEAEMRTLQCESLTLGMKRAEGKLQANGDLSSRQQGEIDNLRRNNKKLLIERVKADEERCKAVVALRTCRSELAQTREQLQNQTGETDLFSELESLVTENTALQQQLESSQEKAELGQQLEELEGQLDRARETLQETSRERDGTLNELALQKSKTAELRQNLAVAEAAVETAEARRKKSEDLVSSMTFVHEQDQAKIRELEETLAAAQGGLEEIRLEATGVQTEMGRELQQLGAECAGLKERVKGQSEQLHSEREARAGEVASLKEAIQNHEQSAAHLQTELQARESANSINQATIAQLQTTCEQAEQEKAQLERSLEEALRQSHQLQREVEELQATVRGLESAKAQLTGETQSLAASSADMKLSLTQSNGKIESLSARLETAQAELTQTQQRLEKIATESQETEKNLTELEKKYRESEKKLEAAESRGQEVTLSLHRREEEVSRLKTQLEMTESEQNQLQSSVALLRTATSSQEKKIKSLEGERENLSSAVDQLTATQEMLKSVINSLESEKMQSEGKWESEMDTMRQQLEEKKEMEREHLAKIQQLERLYREAQATTEELLAAQEALRGSLTLLGDEREGEVVRLREQLVALQKSVVVSQQEASATRTREEALTDELSKTANESEATSKRCSELQDEVEQLQEEVEGLRETEKGLAEFHQKLDVLEENKRERSDKMVVTENELEATTRELQVVKTENESLLERVAEVASVNLALAETTAELGKIRGELAAETKSRKEAMEERERLLGVLQRLEVGRHTANVAVVPESASSWQEADREGLLAVAREKEEEAVRLKEYVAKLLSAVVEKAPFLLERIQ